MKYVFHVGWMDRTETLSVYGKVASSNVGEYDILIAGLTVLIYMYKLTISFLGLLFVPLLLL